MSAKPEQIAADVADMNVKTTVEVDAKVLKKLEEDLAEFRKQNAMMSAQLRTQRQTLKAEVDTANADSEKFQSECNAERKKTDEAQQHIEALNNQLAQVNASFKILGEECSKTKEQLAAKDNELSTATSLNEQLNQQITILTGSNASIKQENALHKSNLSTMREALSKENELKAANELQLSTLKTELTTLKNEQDSSLSSIKELKESLENSRSTLRQSEVDNSKNSKKHADELSKKNKELDDLKRERDDFSGKIISLKATIVQLENEQNNLQRLLKEASSERDRLKSAIEKMRTENNAARNKLLMEVNGYSSRESSLNVECGELTQQLSLAKLKIKELSNVRPDELRAQIRKEILAEIYAKNKKDGYDNDGAAALSSSSAATTSSIVKPLASAPSSTSTNATSVPLVTPQYNNQQKGSAPAAATDTDKKTPKKNGNRTFK